ncbi:MAG: hypothetical protein GEV09_00705 [Pseudonocardiaceae bacterium]|nr:hypothetical protein [Pseudonocardiaceae bacterium]
MLNTSVPPRPPEEPELAAEPPTGHRVLPSRTLPDDQPRVPGPVAVAGFPIDAPFRRARQVRPTWLRGVSGI